MEILKWRRNPKSTPNDYLSPWNILMAKQTIRNYGDGTMAKKKTPNKTARKPATKSTKRTGEKSAKGTDKMSAKRPLTKPTKSPAKNASVKAAGTTSKKTTEPTKSPAKNVTIEAATPISRQATEEAANPERTWVVWQDGMGIWVGTQQDFKHSKRPETIVCDVIDRGSHQASTALQRAIQLGLTLRQTYATYMKYWLQYDDAAQGQRIQEWYERLTM